MESGTFTPQRFALLLADGAGDIMPWIGAGVGAALVLFFAFMGIRKGIQFFRGTSGSYDKDGNWSGPSTWSAHDQAYEDFKNKTSLTAP